MPSTTAGDRFAVARALREIAHRLSLQEGEARFRARAYERAAKTLERTGEDLGRLVAEGRLTELPGIGPALASAITELHETGCSPRLERLREELPAAVLEMAPVIGLPTARKLHAALRLTGLAELREALEAGRIREVHGFGPRREAALLERLRQRTASAPRVLLHHALAEVGPLRDALDAWPHTRVDVAGDLRRGTETVEAIDLVVATADPDGFLGHARAHPLLTSLAEMPEGASAVLPDGLPVRLWLVPEHERGPALVRRTGSATHVARLGPMAPGEIDVREEADVYARRGLTYIEPELREDAGEIESARRGDLPSPLLQQSDLLGAVHCHTVASDGRHTLLQMARAAQTRGFRYLTVTDHSSAAHYAGGLVLDRLKEQWDEIARVQETVEIRLLRGTECDILRDGALDWPDAVLEQLDVVIASIHERFRLDADAMTARVVRAMKHPAFKIWGHPLGRLIGRRPPYECRIEEILDVLAGSRGAVEINGDPHRLDLEPRLVRLARERGLRFVVSTDAHSMGELGNVRYGTLMARRGWLTPKDVLNTLPADGFARAVKPSA